MKLIILCFTGLTMAWLGLNAILVGLFNWEQGGALVPLLLGGLVMLVAIWLLLGGVGLYCRPASGRRGGRGSL